MKDFTETIDVHFFILGGFKYVIQAAKLQQSQPTNMEIIDRTTSNKRKMQNIGYVRVAKNTNQLSRMP